MQIQYAETAIEIPIKDHVAKMKNYKSWADLEFNLKEERAEIRRLKKLVRQIAVVKLMTDGLCYKQIAAALNYNLNSLNTFLSYTRKDHNVNTNEQLVYYFIKKQFLKI